MTGATGTGKTVILQTLAAASSRRGVPALLPDASKDPTGITRPGRVGTELARGPPSAGDNASKCAADNGNVSAASIGSVQRGLLRIDRA